MRITKPRISIKSYLKKPEFQFDRNDLGQTVRSIKVLIKREVLNYFSSPLAYIVLGLFILVVSIIFFGVYQYLQFGTNDLTQMFSAIAFAFIIIIPALTMGSISKEKQSGTIESILTQPITEFQLLASKFLSNAFILLISLFLTLPLTLVVGYLAPIDIGQIIMQYTGAYLIGLCFISIGIAVSSFFKSEITSLLIAVAISILFIVTGTQFLNFFPLEIQSIIERLSLLTHYQSISRGVVDVRDLFYFLGFILAFLGIAYYALVRIKYPQSHKSLNQAKFSLVLVLVIAVLVGIVGQVVPGRIDFTSNQKFTLSPETRNLLDSIQDRVEIKFYGSSNLPVEFQSLKRDVEDILRDYVLASNGKISLVNLDPQTDGSAREAAETDGLQELVFAVDSDDASQRVVGFLGVTFKYKESKEILNISNEISRDLEYQISRIIKKVSTEDKIDVGFVTNSVTQSLFSTYTIYNSELRQLYDVVDLLLTKDNSEIPENIKAVILAGPTEEYDDEVIASLKEFYGNGGSIFLLADTIEISNDSGIPQLNEQSLGDLFSEYGVTVENNFVYDLKQNNLIGVGSGAFRVPVEYPLWFIANAAENAEEALKNVSNISILWGSSINVDESRLNGTRLYKLFETTEEGNVQNLENINITVETQIQPKEDDSKRLVAVALENEKGGRAVIVGDSDFLTDEIIQELNARQQGLDALNMAFAIGSVEWSTKDNQLSSIKARNRLPTRIAIADRERALLIGVGSAFPLIVTSIAGAVVLYRRKKLVNKSYS